MSLIFFFAALALVSIIVSILAATAVMSTGVHDRIGAFSTGLIGVAICAALAFAALYLIDPDPVSGYDTPMQHAMRTLPLTAFSALIWLPIYMSVYSMLRRKRDGAS